MLFKVNFHHSECYCECEGFVICKEVDRVYKFGIVNLEYG